MQIDRKLIKLMNEINVQNDCIYGPSLKQEYAKAKLADQKLLFRENKSFELIKYYEEA